MEVPDPILHVAIDVEFDADHEISYYVGRVQVEGVDIFTIHLHTDRAKMMAEGGIPTPAYLEYAEDEEDAKGKTLMAFAKKMKEVLGE